MACLHPISTMNGLILNVTAILLWHWKELIRFWWPWLRFQGHRRPRIVEWWLAAPYLLNEWNDFDQTCTAILLRQCKNWLDLVTLTPFSRSHEGFFYWKWHVCTLSHEELDKFWSTAVLLRHWPYFQGHTRPYKILAQIYCWDMDWFDLSDQDPFLKVIKGLIMLINGLSTPYCHLVEDMSQIFLFPLKRNICILFCTGNVNFKYIRLSLSRIP